MAGYLTTEELDSAERTLIKLSQKRTYPEVLFHLKTHKLPVKHPYSGLAPFLGKDGLLRVGGRLRKSCLPEHTKQPVILSIKSHIVQLIIQHIHILILHAGAATTNV